MTTKTEKAIKAALYHANINALMAKSILLAKQVRRENLVSEGSLRALELIDGAQDFTFGSAITTPGAAKQSRVQILQDLDTDFQAYDAVEDNKEVIPDLCHMTFSLYSNSQFLYVPFVVRLENGETIPATDFDDEADPSIAIAATLSAGAFSVKLGKAGLSHRIFSNGNPIHVANPTIDYTNEIKKYMVDYYRSVREETLTPVFKIGSFTHELVANTAVNGSFTRTHLYHMRVRKPNL